MPYVQRDSEGNITGAFFSKQEGIAEEWLEESIYEEYKSSLSSSNPFSRKTANRQFLESVGLLPVWQKIYSIAKTSLSAQASFTLILAALTGNFDIVFIVTPFRDLLSTIESDPNIEDLLEEDLFDLRKCLEDAGFNADLFFNN